MSDDWMPDLMLNASYRPPGLHYLGTESEIGLVSCYYSWRMDSSSIQSYNIGDF